MYAVIKTGGKQYRVKEGDLLEIEKLGAEKGQKINFDQVFLIEDEGRVLVGTPVVENAVVRAEVVENYKGDKVLIFKKKRRKQYRRTKGHRQELTKVRIEKIHPDTKLVPEDDLRVEALPVRTAAPKVETPAKKAPKPAVKKAAQPKAAPKKKTEAKPTAKPKKKVKE
ncbi:50S ribosomal protein L21 [bacterium]|nr:MAG: 50S ribosomal protein L21 [bacterium]